MKIVFSILSFIILMTAGYEAECNSAYQTPNQEMQSIDLSTGTQKLTGVSEIVNPFKPGSEPLEGINGIIWEADVRTEKDMVLMKCNIDDNPQTCMYRKNGHIITLKPYEPIRIRYYFWRGRLCYAELTTRGEKSWGELKAFIFDKYGEAIPNAAQSEYVWKGDKISAWMYYSNRTQKSAFMIFFNEIMEEMERTADEAKESRQERAP